MTITGRQIREARALLRLQRNDLAAKVRIVTAGAILHAELVADQGRAGRCHPANAGARWR